MDKMEETAKKASEEKLLHKVEPNAIVAKSSTPLMIGVILAVILLGVLTGFGVNAVTSGKVSVSGLMSKGDGKSADTKQTAGILDKKTFPDDAEGILREGGFEGEGSFHLERPGGKDQTAYLTSTTVDLNQFVGKKVRVWGQTFDAKKAGWLMDIGYIEILN